MKDDWLIDWLMFYAVSAIFQQYSYIHISFEMLDQKAIEDFIDMYPQCNCNDQIIEDVGIFELPFPRKS